MPVTTTYEAYREVAGVRVPFVTIETNEATGRTIYETLGVESDVEVAADTFVVEFAQAAP